MTVTTLPTATPLISKQQLLLNGLEDTGEQAFARIVAKTYGFRVSNTWRRTIDNIIEDISSKEPKYSKCTEASLETLVDRVIISADHHFSVHTISSADANNIRSSLSQQIGQIQSNHYSNIYPELADFDKHNANEGTYLCKISDMGDGIAVIYASIVLDSYVPIASRRGNAKSTTYSQFFHTVFIPNDGDRLEIRISNKAPARLRENHYKDVRKNFTDMLANVGVGFQANIINFFNCIKSYFDDEKADRIVHAILTTGQDSKDADLKNVKSKDYCARTQKVTDTKNNFDYVCRAVIIRKPYLNDVNREVDVMFFPHKNDWERGICDVIHIKKPESSSLLSLIIADAIKRSK